MYCPNCATQNSDDTKFCRSCGANLSLVPQALSGQLPETRPERHGRRERHRGEHQNPPSVSDGITKVFAGIGFLLAAFGAMLYAPAGRIWWFWLLIPAFATMGKGVAEIVAAKYEQDRLLRATPAAMPPAHRPAVVPRRDTGELPPPPPSVTENTTRQLDPNRSKEAQ
ncbi:MAG: zinc-ribbon domain-containing protein [Blastocatellia bacterium]|nr:zinc-ribbon domain-containing protein [Blastocatellia bacterium]